VSDQPHANGGAHGNGQALVVSSYEMQRAIAGPIALRRAGPQLDQKALRQWLDRVTHPDTKQYRCTIFQLVYTTAQGPEPCSTHPHGKPAAGPERDASLDQITQEVARTSADVAETLPSVTHFVLTAFRSDDFEKGAHTAFHFNVAPGPDAEALGAAAYGGEGNPGAALGHVQRLLDTVVRAAFTAGQQDKDRLVDEKARLLLHNERMYAQLLDQRVAMEDLLDRRAEREINTTRTKNQIEMEYQVYKALMNYGLPILAAYVSNKTGAQAKVSGPTVDATITPASPVGAAVGGPPDLLSFARTLSPSQLLGFIDSLTEAQRESFAPMAMQLAREFSPEQQAELGRLATEKAKAEDAAKAAKNGGGT
jgi:hypothetical protein